MLTLFQALILGIVQGVTEFLPVSSSGHLILFPWFFGWQDAGLAFSVWLHLGTLLAVLIYFRADILGLLMAGVGKKGPDGHGHFVQDRRLFWSLIAATIPGVLAGYFLHDAAETTFRHPLLVATVLALVGVVLYLSDLKSKTEVDFKAITFTQSLWIGFAQAFAIVPGTSRSGATMAMARSLGINRTAAAKFSFLLGVPLIVGASLYEILKLWQNPELVPSVGISLVGFGTSFGVGLLSIHWLMQFVQNKGYGWFAAYRLVLALIIVVAFYFTQGG